MMTDSFGSASDSLIAPARNAFAITPQDNTDLGAFTKAIYVGTGGTIVLRAIGSETDVTLSNVQDGSILDIRCSAIRATGTSASDIVGLA